MKVTSNADDAMINLLIDSATEFGEKYTGREFRANTWKLLLDLFGDRITLNRNPVASIATVKHLVSDSLVTVASSVYYLKDGVQCAEILLKENQAWPTDTDDREQAIEIIFVTEAYRSDKNIDIAILEHVAFMYSNRGDCTVKDSAKSSGATSFYDQFRISRV